MKRRMLLLVGGFIATAGAGVSLSGCGQSAPPTAGLPGQSAAEKGAVKPSTDEEHGHKSGAHGGTLVSLGRDSYHAEAVFEKGGLVRLYVLGKEEARVQEVDIQDLRSECISVQTARLRLTT